jgi:hypothetical protein
MKSSRENTPVKKSGPALPMPWAGQGLAFVYARLRKKSRHQFKINVGSDFLIGLP